MASNDDILGISAHVDLSDVINSLNRLHDEFGKLNNLSKETSDALEKSFREISNATEKDLQQKCKSALDVFSQAFEEAKNNAIKNSVKIEESISVFTTEFAKANAAIDTANAIRSASTGGTVMNAAAHGAAAVAVGAEATQHVQNAQNIGEETKAVSENVEKKTESIEVSKQNVDIFQQEAASIDAVTQRVKEKTAAENEATNTLQYYEDRIASLTEEHNKLGHQVDEARKKMEETPSVVVNGKLDSTEAEKAWEIYEALRQKYVQMGSDIETLTSAYDRLKEAQNQTTTAGNEAADSTSRATQAVKDEAQAHTEAKTAIEDAYDSQQKKITELLDQYNELKKKREDALTVAHIGDGALMVPPGAVDMGTTFGSERLKQAKEYGKELKVLRDKIKEAYEEEERLQDAMNRGVKDDPFGVVTQSADQLRERIKDVQQTLNDFQSEYDKLSKGDITEGKEEKLKQLSDTIRTHKDELTACQQQLEAVTPSYQKVIGKVGEYWEKLQDVATGHGKFQEGLSRMSGAFGSMGLPLQSAIRGVKEFNAGLWTLCKNPIGAVIAAIVLSVQALTMWFKKSADGQKAFAQISAFVGSILSSLTDIVVKVGRYLFHAFADAQGPMNSFAKGLVTTLRSAVKAASSLLGGLGDMVRGVVSAFKGDFDAAWTYIKNGGMSIAGGLKSSVETIGNAFSTTLKGIGGALEMTGKGAKELFNGNVESTMKNMLDTAKQSAILAKQEAENNIAIHEAKKEQALLDMQIAKNREKIYTLTGKEKDALIEETKQLQKQKYDDLIKTQKTQYEIQKQRNSLHEVTLDDLAKERELELQIIHTETQREASTRMLTRMQEANKRKMENAAKQAAKQNAKDNKADSKNEAQLVQLERAESDKIIKTKLALKYAEMEADIAATKDAAERERKQEDYEHKKRLDDIAQKAEELKKARYEANKKQWELQNKDKHYETDSAEGRAGWQGVALSGDETALLNAELAKENAEYERAARERAESLVASHQSYTDRKLAIDKQYSEDVKRIDAEIAAAQARGDNDSVAALQRSKRQAATDRAKNQSALSLDILKESPEYIRAFEDLEQTSSETLEYLIEEFEKAKQAAAQSLDPKDLKEYTDTIQRMQDEISSRNPFKTLKKSMDDLRKSEKDMKDAKKRLELVKQGVKVVKSYRKEGDKMVAVYYDEIEAQKEYNKSEDEYLKNRKKVKKVHKELQDEWSELGQQVQQLGQQIGGLGGECISMIGDIMNFAVNISQTIDIVTTATAQGISAIEKASAILAIIQVAIQVVQAMASLLSGIFGDSDNGFTAAKEQYDNLSKVWDELIDKKRKYLNESWSNEAKQASKEAIELLKAEQAMNKIVAEARLGAGASAGSHSYGYRMWQGSYGYDGKNWQDVAGEISRKLGVRFTGMSDMLNMSAEQLEWIKKNYTGLWANMDGEFQNALENIITFSTTEAEILEELKERITGSSLSDIYDNMMDSLYELANGSEDVMDDIAENWQEMVNRMVVNNVVGTRVKEELKSWYEELYNLQDRYNDHLLNDSAYQQELERLRNSYNTIVTSSQQEIENFRQMGIIKTLEETAEEAKKYFEDILESWKDTLTDMESTTEDWKNALIDQIFSDLVESTILNAPLTVGKKTFENFEKYLQDWTERYKNTVEDATLSDEERTRRLKELIDEQTALREQQAEKSKQLAESIGKDMSEAISNSLDNLGDSLIEGLLANTEADAENAGKQIALTLIKEMLQTMLASEKYKGRMEEIRNKWQQLLNGEDVAFTMDDVLQDIANLNNDIANDESISALAQQYKELNKQVENTQTVFNDLHNTFLNTLTDMKGDAESFRKTLEQTMLKDFIDKQVLDVPITVNGMDFDDFNAYVEDWNKRYAEGVKEGNMEAVDALLDELMQVRELTLSQAEDLRKRLEDSMHELGSGFNNLREQFIKTLTNIVGDAESLGKEIGQSMMEQMLNAFVEKQYSDRINAVNEEWAKALEEGDPQRIDEIRQKVINLYETISSDRVVKQLSDDIKALTDTGTTPFDNLRSSYLAALTDMNKSTEDFTKEISQMIAQSFVDSFVLGDMFDDRIEAWKKKYKDITTDAGLSEEERMKQLRGLSEMIAAERESMQGQVSDIYKLLGINDHQDQEATMSLAEAATYDQFELYLGIATAQQIALEQGNVVRQQILSTLQTMGQITSPTNPTLLEMRNMFSTANEYLLDIKRSNRAILDNFSMKLDSIYGKLRKL